uniref:Uncharacterized protein n=1 Tax=Megaselia scalaris TaxID=36166 RepID=T1GPK5_MEGSC
MEVINLDVSEADSILHNLKPILCLHAVATEWLIYTRSKPSLDRRLKCSSCTSAGMGTSCNLHFYTFDSNRHVFKKKNLKFYEKRNETSPAFFKTHHHFKISSNLIKDS